MEFEFKKFIHFLARTMECCSVICHWHAFKIKHWKQIALG